MMPDAESQSSAPGGGGGKELSEVELQHLAEKVYRLLQADLRLSRARGEPPPRNSRHAGGAS
jgi:hypothetical protein